MQAWRLTTQDLRPPLQGGDPIWDGSFPYVLPEVEVDTSDAYCGQGWNACGTLSDAISIAGEWPNGCPSRAWLVESIEGHPVIERSTKLRAASWTIVREATADEWLEARQVLYAPLVGDGLILEQIIDEVEAWRKALARPSHDSEVVEAGLRQALDARGLGDWSPQQFDTPWDTRGAWDARDARVAGDAREVWHAWHAWAARAAGDAWDAKAAWAAWGAWDAGDARDTRDAWDAWDTKAAWAAWDAGDARDALTVFAARGRGLVPGDPHLLTTGLRNAYQHGLGIVVPVRQKTLGWAMTAP